MIPSPSKSDYVRAEGVQYVDVPCCDVPGFMQPTPIEFELYFDC